MKNFDIIRRNIIDDIENKVYKEKGYEPLYFVSEKSKIMIVGQAPGIKAQEKNTAWDDLSGEKLRQWLGVTKDEFYNTDNFAIVPMDFYFPGKGKTGDLPPRKGFAEKWHTQIINELKELKLIILIGNYAQKYYLQDRFIKNLTETVKNYKSFLPKYIPLPHPSPLNIRWFIKNPWFEKEVIPMLKDEVNKILKK